MDVVIQNILIALALGALIGLEREFSGYKRRYENFAGIRTYPLIALLGAIAAMFTLHVSMWVFIASLMIVGILITVGYFIVAHKNPKHFGATSEIAGIITFFIGALCAYNQITVAAVITVIMMLILYGKTLLHKFAKKITHEELSDTIKFAIVALVILPFLPNQGFGPHEIFNPYIIWLMVVFISGIGFVGYILMKWLGERGVALAGVLGGLISSTAVTTSFADRSTKQPKIYQALVLGVVLANGIMFIRILIEVFVLNRELFYKLLLPLSSLAALTLVFSFFLYKNAKKVKGKIELGSPFRLAPALKFGIFFAVILGLVKLADVYLSSSGVYIVSLISGFADVDAITVSLSQLAGSSLAMETAMRGIMIAALTNVAVKGGIAWWFGERRFRFSIVSLFLILIAVGIGLMFVI